jgi:hypothetical protein
MLDPKRSRSGLSEEKGVSGSHLHKGCVCRDDGGVD